MSDEIRDPQPNKRYVVTMDFYLWAESDDYAIKAAEIIAFQMNDRMDNRAAVLNIVEQPFGKIGSNRVIFPPSREQLYTPMDEMKKNIVSYEAAAEKHEAWYRSIEPKDKESKEWEAWYDEYKQNAPHHPDGKTDII